MGLTPGLRYILRGLVKLSLPTLGFFAGTYVLDEVFNYPLPPILKWTLVASAGPLIAFTLSVRSWVKQDREMRALGARKPPVLPGRWPGNVDVLFRLIKELGTGYIGPCYIMFP